MYEELNKKLAEWADLNTTHKFQPIGFDNIEACIHCGQSKEYVLAKYCDVPDFTSSLDACFKWLVPKLWVCTLTIEEGIFAEAKVGHPNRGTASHLEEIKDGRLLETFALALCLAIVKLIDR